ncbi:nucleoside 2-deoxyribosyltransferase [Cupriavidus basilensis]
MSYHNQVIKPVCENAGVAAIRVDEQFGPGMIIQDIVQQLRESAVVIAEITPANPNVYYEVGYAHALGKPTILIAEQGIKLPFDVSPLSRSYVRKFN